MQGSRAAGVPTIGGLIRSGEIDDGSPMYKHALAMSMTFNALSASPTYIYPATSADGDAATTNSGAIPEGALMLLPANFDLSRIRDAKLLKVAKTLMSYGAYVVDRNYGTPYVIYVEIGSGWNLMPNGWDNEVASELDFIRANLRQVTNVTQWVDANGTPFTPDRNQNLLSMRGGWYITQGPGAGSFSTGTYSSWEQAVVFPNNGQRMVQVNGSGRGVPTPGTVGRTYRMTVTATGGATLALNLNGVTSGDLGNGGVFTFVWPSNPGAAVTTTSSGPSGGGKVSATLVQID